MSERLAGMPQFWGRRPTATSKFRQRSRLDLILMIILALGAIAAVVVLVRFVVISPTGPALVTILAWAIWTAVLFCLISLVDVYRHVPWSIRLGLFIWGGSVAALAAMLAETVFDPLLGPLGGSLGPGLFEEATKVVGVILVAALVPVLFRRPMGGLICGMMVGLGFCFLENIFYANAAVSGAGANPSTAEAFVVLGRELLQRGFVDGAGLHIVLTGLTGLGVAYFVAGRDRGRGRGSRWAGALTFFVGAVVFHFLWDLGSGAQTVAAAVLVNVLNVLHFVLVALMIIYAVRAERRWLASVTPDNEPVIESEERNTLRTHKTRRKARAAVTDGAARKRVETRQWAQIGYVDATNDDEAPDTETDRLARYVTILRQPASGTVGRGQGDIPAQRQSAPSDQEHPTTGSAN